MLWASLIFCLPWFALLAFGAWRAKPHLAMICVGALMCFIPAAIGYENTKNADSLGVIGVPIVAAVLGPFAGPISIFSWASEAPWIGFPALVIGLCLGGLVSVYVFKRGWLRRAVVAGFCVFALSSYSASEGLVELRLRMRAAHHFGNNYCLVQRVSVFSMIENGTSDVLPQSHALLISKGRGYHWSFKANDWMAAADGAAIVGAQRLERCRSVGAS